MTQVGEPAKCVNPTFLCSSPDGNYLYAANETGKVEVENDGSYKIVEETG